MKDSIDEKQKKVMFSVGENDKAKFKVRLQYDSLTQVQFFREVIASYIDQDPHFMNFVDHMKVRIKSQSKGQVNKAVRQRTEGKKISNKFALDDNELENIFDILSKEHPDL